MKLYHVCLSVLFLLVSSCSGNKRLELALEFAGDNRTELERVLEYYKDSTLKYRAACFLIENMPRYYSYQGWQIDTIKALRANVDPSGEADPRLVKHWAAFDFHRLDKVYDAHIITADYLIRNIDQAFNVWRGRSWNQSLSFDDFCELLLPYRIDNEPLEDWREKYYDEFSFLLDSVYTGNDVIKASNVVGGHLKKEGFRNNWNFSLPHTGAMYLLKFRIGMCQDSCDFFVYVMRALGIPATTDSYTYSPESQKGHTWNVVRDTTGEYVGFWFVDSEGVRGKKYSDRRKMGKAYRQCFGWQPEKLKGIYKDKQVAPFFRLPYQKDVSDCYFDTKIELNVGDLSQKYVYLGVFRRGEWEGIDIALVKNHKAVFRNLEPEVVYVPLTYDGSHYSPVDLPFFFDGKEVFPYVPDLAHRDTVELLRKHTLFFWVKNHLWSVAKGRVDVADTKDFKKYKMIYMMADTPTTNYNVVDLPEPMKVRYIRYLPAGGRSTQMGDLSFSFKGENVRPVQVFGDFPRAKGMEAENAFDGDPLTFYRSSKPDIPLIADFGKKVWVDRFVYVPRNDDNFIRIGDGYELFYHGGKEGWVTLGRKVATEPRLIYDNMPQGALFYLHNITRGMEEQVFHIDNGKQVFITNMGKLSEWYEDWK